MLVVDDEGRILSIWFRGGSRSNLALFIKPHWHEQTAVSVQPLSNFTYKLWMMRGGTLLIFGLRGPRSTFTLREEEHFWFWITGSKIRVNLNWHFGKASDYKFCPVTSKRSKKLFCWTEEPYWFWVMQSEVKVSFEALPVGPCLTFCWTMLLL